MKSPAKRDCSKYSGWHSDVFVVCVLQTHPLKVQSAPKIFNQHLPQFFFVLQQSNSDITNLLCVCMKCLHNTIDTQENAVGNIAVHQNQKSDLSHFVLVYPSPQPSRTAFEWWKSHRAANRQVAGWCEYSRCLRRISDFGQTNRLQPWKNYSAKSNKKNKNKQQRISAKKLRNYPANYTIWSLKIKNERFTKMQ